MRMTFVLFASRLHAVVNLRSFLTSFREGITTESSISITIEVSLSTNETIVSRGPCRRSGLP